MDRFAAVVLPGFWLGLWQYIVLLCGWLGLILPARQFLHPHPVNEAGLGYFVLGMLVGAAVMPVLLVDATLYVSTLPMNWLKRIGFVVLIGIGGSVAVGMIYLFGFLYGADSMRNAPVRWTWIAIYVAAVSGLLGAHVFAIWRFRTAG